MLRQLMRAVSVRQSCWSYRLMVIILSGYYCAAPPPLRLVPPLRVKFHFAELPDYLELENHMVRL